MTHDDSDPLGAGYLIDLNRSLVADRDIELLHVWPAQEIISLDLSRTRVTNAGLEQLEPFTCLRNLRLRDTNIGDDGLRHLGDLIELRTLDLGGTQVMGPGLAYLQSLRHLEDLNLGGTKLTDSGMEYAKRLPQIRSLHMYNTAVSNRGIAHVAGFPELRRLSIGPMITDEGITQLEGLRRLEELGLKGSGITDSSIQHLKQALPGLRVLDYRSQRRKSPLAANLSHAQAVEEIQRLGGSVAFGDGTSGKPVTSSVYLYALGADDAMLALLGPFDDVRELQLAGGWLSDAGLQRLPPLKQLRSLSLRGDTWRAREEGPRQSLPFGTVYAPEDRDTWISDDGLRPIGEHVKLHSLDLTSTYVTDRGLPFLASLTSLRELGLRNAVVTGEGLRHLRDFAELRSLDVSHTLVDDAGLEYLQALTHLEKLWLGRTLVTDAGIEKLAALKHLRFLDLSHTAITDAGVKELAQLKGLNQINLDYALVTERAVDGLRQALPHAKITAEIVGDRAPRATDAEMKERFEFFP